MAEQTIPDVTVPINPRQIHHGIEHIVEQTFPRPRQELCVPVGKMERRLASYAGDLVNAAYKDSDESASTDRTRLASAAETIAGNLENGPWKLITDPNLRALVGEYVADTCHSIAAAAGLDDIMVAAHDRTPVRLSTGGKLITDGARMRLARHLYVTDASGDAEAAADHWDHGRVNDGMRQRYLDRADAALAAIHRED